MLWIKVKRMVRSGFYSFWRNGFCFAFFRPGYDDNPFVIGSVIFLGAILRSTPAKIKTRLI